MRKFTILGALVALVVAALALPALAQHQQDGSFRFEDQEEYYEGIWDAWADLYEDAEGWEEFEDRYEDDFEDEGFFAFADDRFFGEEDFEDEGFFFGDGGFYFDEEDQEEGFDGSGSGSGVSQSFDQEAESGDVSQSFNVSNTGDNSNQCAGVQGVANTGNAQNQIGVLQYGSEADDFEIEDSGSTITVSPVNATQCDQQVNQAAAAYGR
jgi:hypothetical protein